MKYKNKFKILLKSISNKFESSNQFVKIIMTFLAVVIVSLGLGAALFNIKKTKVEEVKGKSSFSLAISAPQNANFIKYLASQQFASTFTTGLLTPAPPDRIYEVLQLPKISMDYIQSVKDIRQKYSIVDIFGKPNQAGIKKTSRSFARMWKYMYPGMINNTRPLGLTNQNISGIAALEDFSGLLFMIDKKKMWWDWKKKVNGETITVSKPVRAQDFVQTLKYILDLNVGSEHLQPVLELGLNNTDSCNVEQEEYIAEQIDGGASVKKPFGYFWNEEKELLKAASLISEQEFQKVKKEIDLVNKRAKTYTPSCKSLFLELTPERIAEYDLTNSEEAAKLQQMVDNAAVIFNNEYNLLYYKFAIPKSLSTIISNAHLRDGVHFLPSNKEFIDYIGGIDKYGLEKASIIGNGTHKINDIIFGNLGFAKLTPNKSYWDYNNMLTGNVKLIFNQEPLTLDALFMDNKIAATQLTKLTLQKLYNTKTTRQYLKKLTGYGTFALQLNIKATDTTPLSDPDLRRALYYIMNRQQALKIANWDSTFPVTTFTAFEQSAGAVSYKAKIEMFQDAAVVNTEAPAAVGGKNIPLRTIPFSYQKVKSYELESLNKTDKSFLPKVAQFYLNRYKKNHPNENRVSLTFLYDTSQKETERMFILIDSLVRKYFGGFVNIVGKGVPSNFYESLVTTGQFDITARPVEPTGTGVFNYFRFFFWEDGLSNIPGNIKKTGYKTNISGSFTFEKWFKSLSLKKEESVRERLNITKPVWEYMKFLTRPLQSTNPNYNEGYKGKGLIMWKRRVSEIESLAVKKEKINSYKGLNDTVKNFSINSETIKIELSTAFEKVLRESVPVIPIMEVDTYWRATRLYGEQRFNNALVLSFSYLCYDKPMAILPGCSAISG